MAFNGWFFKGGSTQNRWALMSDVFKGGSTQNRWVLMGDFSKGGVHKTDGLWWVINLFRFRQMTRIPLRIFWARWKSWPKWTTKTWSGCTVAARSPNFWSSWSTPSTAISEIFSAPTNQTTATFSPRASCPFPHDSCSGFATKSRLAWNISQTTRYTVTKFSVKMIGLIFSRRKKKEDQFSCSLKVCFPHRSCIEI